MLNCDYNKKNGKIQLSDDLIASRRTAAAAATQQRLRPASKSASVQRNVSNVDRSIATSRAKRNATMNARRGLSDTSKPTPMQIEAAVQKQVQKTNVQNELKHQKQQRQPKDNSTTIAGPAISRRRRRNPRNNRGTNASANDSMDTGKNSAGTPSTQSSIRRLNRKEQKQVTANIVRQKVAKQQQKGATKDPPGHVSAVLPRVARPPPKSAIKAAVNAMEDQGYIIPDGMQMVFSLVPTPVATVSPKKAGSANDGNGLLMHTTNPGVPSSRQQSSSVAAASSSSTSTSPQRNQRGYNVENSNVNSGSQNNQNSRGNNGGRRRR
jgi:hypothetical protein